MLTDDWRRAALHYMEGESKESAAEVRTQAHFSPRRGTVLAVHVLYLPERLAGTTAAIAAKPGKGEKWHRFVFSPRLDIEASG